MTTDVTALATDADAATRPPAGLPIARMPFIGAGLACLALASALVAGAGGTRVPAAILGAGSVVALGVELVRRAARVTRAAGAPILALAGMIALVAAATIWVAATANVAWLAIGAALAVLAGWLIGWGALALRRLGRQTGTPWQAVAGRTRHDAARALLAAAGPLLFGCLLALVAIRAASLQFASGRAVAVAWTILAFGATVAAVAALSARMLDRRPVTQEPRPPDQVAAHLHDSVLQTLALIQRSASDPARVAQLARQQERSLRDWLAGRDEDVASASVAGGIRSAAREVEDEVAGAKVDVVAVGDAPLDRRGEMLVQATREAIRNAARHGTEHVRVFIESGEAKTTVFVRDTGPGFALDEVSPDRRGVRDAIIGRMEYVDGTVTIDTSAHGTEIELTLPAAPA